jgi:hypothetical protein
MSAIIINTLLSALYLSTFDLQPWNGLKLAYFACIITASWGWRPRPNNFITTTKTYTKTSTNTSTPTPDTLQWKQIKNSDVLLYEFVVSKKTALKLVRLLEHKIEYLNITLKNGLETVLDPIQFETAKNYNNLGEAIASKELALMANHHSQLLLHHWSSKSSPSEKLLKQFKGCSQIISCYGAHHPVKFKHLTPGIDAPVCVNLHDLGVLEGHRIYDDWVYEHTEHCVLVSLFIERE